MVAPYAAGYAQLYDLFYRDKPYEQEVEFVHDRLCEHGIGRGGRVLELACGTGEHAVRLAQRGYAVTATDRSEAMVALARKKAKSKKATVDFIQRDMQKLSAPIRPFDAAICLFDSIGYVQTDTAVAAVIDGVYASLRSGGIFLVEFWHAPAMLNGFDPVRIRRFQQGTTIYFRVSTTKLEPDRSLAHVTYNVYELRRDATFGSVKERHTNRYFTVPEMERLARDRGFTPLGAYDGFHRTPVSDRTWHVVALWEKAKTASRPPA